MSEEVKKYEEKKYPVQQSAICASSAATIMFITDVLAHLGPTGLLVGGIASFVAWRHGPELYEQARGLLPAPAQAGQSEQTEKLLRQRSWLDRALGRHPEGEPAPEEAEVDDTVIVPEEEIQPSQENKKEVQEQPSRSSAEISTIMVRAEHPEREILLAANLGLDIDEVIEAGVFVAGMKGSGKSELAAHLMEQLGRFPLPQIVYCLKGDFTSLVASHFMNGLIMTRQHLYDARTILSCRLQVVVDLRSWETMEERAYVIASLNQALLKHAMALPEQLRIPWFVHLDEAQQFVSQQKPVGIELPTWKWVTQAVTNLGILGRSYGAVPCLYTQRIADIHKDVISQQEIRIFMKVALDNDLKRYEEYISAKTARREDIQRFRAGDAVVILPDGRQFIIHFLRRESKHGSHTPHLTQALLLPVGQADLQPAQPYQLDAPQAGRSVLPEQLAFQQPGSDASPNPPGAAKGAPRAFAPEPYAQPAQPDASAQAPVSWQEAEKSQHFTKALGPELQAAYDAYRSGMHHHTLARHLGTTPAVAGHLLKQLQVRGLIDDAGNKTMVPPQENPGRHDRAIAIRHELRRSGPLHVSKEQGPAEEQRKASASPSILNLPDYQRKPEQRIPTLQEVIDAFPNQLPSKRDIMKRFGINDHQAYKLYRELDRLVGRLGGRLGEANEESN